MRKCAWLLLVLSPLGSDSFRRWCDPAGITHFSCGRDVDPVTLIQELDLVILKMYLHTENEVNRSRLSKVRAQTEHTDKKCN